MIKAPEFCHHPEFWFVIFLFLFKRLIFSNNLMLQEGIFAACFLKCKNKSEG